MSPPLLAEQNSTFIVFGKMSMKTTCPSVRPYVFSPKTLNEL